MFVAIERILLSSILGHFVIAAQFTAIVGMLATMGGVPTTGSARLIVLGIDTLRRSSLL